MSIDIYSYNNASDLANILQGINGDNLRCVIPSRKDKFFFPMKDSHSELWTWQDIYDDITRDAKQERKATLSPPDHLLILKWILSEVTASYRDKINALPGIDMPGFLEVISEDIRELLNEAVSPDQLTHNPESDNPSEFLLPEVYSRYTKYLGNRLIDSAQICTSSLDALIKNQEWGKDLVIVFTGFLSFNHGQLELVKALTDRCIQVIIIKPEANLARFGDASSQFGKDSHAQPSSGKIIELEVSEPGLEPELIARNLALWSAGELADWGEFPGFDAIGLMLSQGREESFAQAFTRYGVPYDFMSGVPISQTLPGKVLSSLRTLSTRQFPTYETALLLTQPCFAGMRFPVMSAYRAGRSGLANWKEYLAANDDEVFRDALSSINAIEKFCAVMSVNHTPLQIMRAFCEFLKTPGLWLGRKDDSVDFPEFDESTRLTASAIETIEHKVLALDELLPDLGQVQDERFSQDASYDFLESWCRNTNTRAPIQITNAVRIFTGQPPVLAAFPVWIMTGITQKTWSGNITASPLLGNEARAKLADVDVKLPTTSEKALQHEALFRRLLHTGETLTLLSRPMLDDEGRPVAESPFMQNFINDMKAWDIKKARDEPEGISILLGGDGFTFPEIDPEGKAERKTPLVIKKAASVGASDIQELLLCPFLWWQKRQARIYERDSELASPVEWGKMLHKYWECVWRRYSEDMTASGDEFKKIALSEWTRLTDSKTVHEEYKEYHRLVADSRLHRRLGSIHFRVKRLAQVQADILDGLHKAGWVHREILMEKGDRDSESAQLKAKFSGVTFLGQCDRIEILTDPNGNETAFIADYKTGKGESSEESTKISSYWWDTKPLEKFSKGLQLSVYAALFERCNLSGVYILGLESGKISGTISQPADAIFKPYASDKFGGTIQGRIDEGNYAMECAVRVLHKGEFSPGYDSKLCQYCKIKSMCRKGEFKSYTVSDDD
ncbi:MAG: PD-(D/E)XK nuclease family protein [Synergistaceae bacterium]|nr:PD-(D/E)XK nuclease family protein [Synergistaceae bacterium]